MIKRIENLSGAWSATPTPLTKYLKIDKVSVKKLVNHHLRLNQRGLFIGGTCGEGPFLKEDDCRRLTSLVADYNDGQMAVAVQVTDNSYIKVIDKIKLAKRDGADIAILAEPWFAGPMKERHILKYYTEALDNSELPVGIYSRGGKEVPAKHYKKILSHPNVCMFKDSSRNKEIMKIALDLVKKRKSLTLMTGFELGMPPYLKAGYTGILAGGGILTGHLTSQMIQAAKQEEWAKVEKLQKHCNKINYTAYGGKNIASWLTGLKYTLVKMGIFRSAAGYLDYPLTDSIRNKIDVMIEKEKGVLLP